MSGSTQPLSTDATESVESNTGKRSKSDPDFYSEIGKLGGRPRKSESELLKLGNDLIKWIQADKEHIFFRDYLLQNDLDKDAISEYMDRSEAFAGIIKKAKEMQEMKLMQGLVTSKLNTTGAIFVAKNYHGMATEPNAGGGFLNGSPVQIVFNLPQAPQIQQIQDASFQVVPPQKIEPPEDIEDNSRE